MAKTKKETTIHTAVRLPVSLIEKAKKQADEEDRSFNSLVVLALRKYTSKTKTTKKAA